MIFSREREIIVLSFDDYKVMRKELQTTLGHKFHDQAHGIGDEIAYPKRDENE